MTLDDAVAEADPCYPTIEDHGKEISAHTQKMFASLNGIQEKIFELADNLPLREGLKVIVNTRRKH